jgi:MSHA type pilus biogenesis protein MshL
MVMPILFLGGTVGLPAQQPTPKTLTLSVRDADWKDVLRAAMESTNLNLSFDPDVETRVKGLDLKGVTLQELLDEILPDYGLGYVRTGRSIHIMKSDGGLRFYQVDSLALHRTGTKDFMVSASGQTIQTGSSGSSGGGSSSSGSGGSGGSGGSSGSGGSGGSSSSYTSSLSTSNGTDPWEELELGLRTLIFGGSAPEPQTTAAQQPGASSGGPASSAYYKDGKSLLINPGSGMVAVAADAATHRKVERFLAEMRRRSRRQVLLEAKIVEVTLSNDSQLGVNWNSVLTPGASQGATGTGVTSSFVPGAVTNTTVQNTAGLFTLGVANARVSATLTALAQDGKLKVLSSPRLTALNNQKAILRVVQEQAYFTTTSTTTGAGSTTGAVTTVSITPMVVPVGIVLDIQPEVGDDGSITLAVNPSVSSVVRVATKEVDDANNNPLASADLPVVNRRDLDTVVRIQSGETLVLAGIIQTSDSATNTGVPWLDRIPFLGALFKKKEISKARTELAIFITPTLMEDGGEIAASRLEAEKRLKDAGADAALPGKPKQPITEP